MTLKQPQELHYPFLLQCPAPSVCPNSGVGASVWNLEFCTHTLIHAIAHGGCRNIATQTALKFDSERKSLAATGNPNPRQYCFWLFGSTLYQLCYSAPVLQRPCNKVKAINQGMNGYTTNRVIAVQNMKDLVQAVRDKANVKLFVKAGNT